MSSAGSVTVRGNDGNIVLSSSSTEIVASAQSALFAISTQVGSGGYGFGSYSGGGSVAITGEMTQNLVTSTLPGLQLITTPLPNNATVLIASGSGTLGAIGGTEANASVFSSSTEDLVYDNQGTNTSLYLLGGYNLVRNITSSASMVVNVGGAPGLGGAGAIVDAQIGSASINAFNNSVVQVIGGGADTVFAQPGTELIGVTGSSTVPVTIVGLAGANIVYGPGGGNAFINPSSGNVTVLAGTGSETLFGGAATIGGTAYSAPAFTGAATVFSGTGDFRGGTAGSNVLVSSTVVGGSTLIGGGNNDYLASNAAGNLLSAGAGANVTLAGFGGPDTFIGGSGSGTIFGSATGGNTIAFGSGAFLAYGEHAGATGNTFVQLAAAGSDTIGDFISGEDKFSLSASPTPQTLASIATAGSGSVATLSDGTRITFNNVIVKTTDFS